MQSTMLKHGKASRMHSTSSKRGGAAVMLSLVLIALHSLVFIYTSTGISSRHLSTVQSRTSLYESPSIPIDRFVDHGGKFAYSYVVVGCEEKSCLGYIFNAVVATQVLQYYNSTSDVLFQVRMASGQNMSRLPSDQEELLQKAGVQVRYLPKVRRDDFGTATLEKFRIVELTDYDRVYFLDIDLIPLCNDDYVMQASYDGILERYVGVQGEVAPLTADTFIVTPQKGMFQKIMDIVHRHRNRSQSFDVEVGWGHNIDEKDRWVGYEYHARANTSWTMPGAQIDQGILYYWMKYKLLNWSQFLRGGYVRTWHDVTYNRNVWQNKTDVFEVPDSKYIANVKTFKLSAIPKCGKKFRSQIIQNTVPYLDTYHYGGARGSWLQKIDAAKAPKELRDDLEQEQVWHYWLGVANRTLQLGIPSILHISGPKYAGSSFVDLFDQRDLDILLRPDAELPLAT